VAKTEDRNLRRAVSLESPIPRSSILQYPKIQSKMSSFTNSDDVGAVVADLGSFATRIGFAGDDAPTAHFPAVSSLKSN